MISVYAVYNKNYQKIYIGQTKNLAERVRMHNEKIFGKSYTARFAGEWLMVYSEEVADRKVALAREKQLKSYQGRKFLEQFIPR